MSFSRSGAQCLKLALSGFSLLQWMLCLTADTKSDVSSMLVMDAW